MSEISKVKQINWDELTFRRFKRAYDKAVTTKAETFEFEDHTFLTTYAMYMIEYLNEAFSRKDGSHEIKVNRKYKGRKRGH